MIRLPYDWLEIDISFVDEFVPVEMVDRCEVFLADLSEFLLELPLYLGNPSWI